MSEKRTAKPDEIERLAAAVERGERRALARAITLVESTRADHRAKAEALLSTAHAGNRQRDPPRHLGLPWGGQVDFHRGLRPPPDRPGTPLGRARGRPLLQARRRLDSRRQDAHGEARRSSPRPSSGPRPREGRSAVSLAARARRSSSPRPRASMSSSSRRSASASRRPRSPTWLTCSSSFCSPRAGTSCKA